MAGRINFTLQDFQDSALKYKEELLLLPILGASDTLQYLSGRPGVRGTERVILPSFNAQFAPYSASMRSNTNLDLDFRDLVTYHGAVATDFEPNSAIQTILGEGAMHKGDGQVEAPTAKLVLALMARSLSYNLNAAIWSGVRNANGSTTQDLFNGFDTITAAEVTAGNLSAAKGNYKKLSAAITRANAADVIKDIMFELDPQLRGQKAYIYCSQNIYDLYNESYQAAHGALPYNTQYNQRAVEGSDGNLVFVPLASKAGSDYIHISTKENMLYGYDTTSDESQILVERYAPFVLTFVASMFFGVQMQSLDKRVLKVIELA